MPHPIFESTDCPRCSGKGVYLHFGTCFRCNGAKYRYTKRGQAAMSYFRTLAYKTLSEFRVGEVLLSEGFAAGSYSVPTEWAEVVEKSEDQIRIKGRKTGTETILAASCFGSSFRRALSAEEKVEVIAKVREYQDSLTKAGTVRKIKSAV